jgi:predicted dehydrogenase
MTSNQNTGPTRRDAMALAGGVALGTLAIGPYLHAAGSETVSIALVGCGGRGTGAAENALRTSKQGPIEVTAMADVFEDRLKGSLGALERDDSLKKQIKVKKDAQFLGFDAYKKAMDALKPGDVVILTTPPAFRWLQFKYAIEKGLHVFMEKPTTVDGPGTRKMIALAEEANKKNLKVGVGLMCRHCPARTELAKRIKDGQMGDLLLLRAYRMKGPEATSRSKMKPKDMNELEFQIRRFHSFLWASGGCYSDFLIHNIDECCWMKDAWPVKAQANGGRMYRIDPADGKEFIDQNFDSYSVEYTFADGAKLLLEGRIMPDCHQEFASYAHGSKGSAIISSNSHWPSGAKIFKGQNRSKDDIVWQCGPEKAQDNPYQVEWDKFIAAVRNDKPYNEARRGAEASLVTSMGRMAAHTGQVITFDQILNGDHEFAPGLEQLKLGGEAPVKADADGRYPVPQPGRKKTEY